LNLRLRRFLLLAAEAQWRLDEEMIETLPALAAEWQEKEIPVGIERPLFPDVLRLLAGLEILEESWRDLLREGESIEVNKENESLLERIAVYFAFRYLLKCVNDGDLLSRAQLCVLAVLVIERLAAVCGLSEALRRFSCELEHSDENLETLQEILFRGEKLSLHQVLCSLGQ
jgi:lysine-N-methylase